MGRIGQTCFNQQCDFITVYSHEYAFDFNVKLKRMSHRSNAFHILHYFFFHPFGKNSVDAFSMDTVIKDIHTLYSWHAFNTKFMSSLIFTLTHKSLCWPLNILVNQNALNSQDLLLEKKQINTYFRKIQFKLFSCFACRLVLSIIWKKKTKVPIHSTLVVYIFKTD